MRTQRPSLTAEAGLAMRSLESARSNRSRLFHDPYAKKFLRSHHQLLIRVCALQSIHRLVEKVCDTVYPGAPGDFICRTRYIDDRVADALAQTPIQRVVILGAGYDTRSFRLAKIPLLQIIEVDHPATQATKIAKAKRVIPPDILERVKFIDLDLMTSLPVPLEVAPTFFILEGLTGYLSSSSVDSLFQWMRDSSAQGSYAVFTYLDQRFLDGHCTGKMAKRVSHFLKKAGEPFKSGWYPEQLSSYCQQRGFRVIENHSQLWFREEYLAPLKRRLQLYDFGHIALVQRQN